MSFCQYLLRLRQSMQGSRPARRAAKRWHQPRIKFCRPCLERLEDRTLLNGNAVAFFVAGYGGQTIPWDTVQYVASLFQTAKDEGAIKNYNIYITNWNSPDPESQQYIYDPQDPSKSRTVGDRTGNPGNLISNLIAPTGADTVLNTPIFKKLLGTNDPQADPALPNEFITKLDKILHDKYDDNDYIFLEGHSFGGNSVLQAADHTNRKIDFLATLDPVGWSTNGIKTTNEAEIIPPEYVNFLGKKYKVPGTPVNIPVPTGAFASIFSTNLIDSNSQDYQQGLPGYRNALPSPKSNVVYFYNRWQMNSPFPLDYRDPGKLDASQVQHNVDSISYDGNPIQQQEDVNDFRDANGKPVVPSSVPNTDADFDKIIKSLFQKPYAACFGRCPLNRKR